MEEHKATDVAVSTHRKLGQLKATAICGNDISSSCLYVSALALLYAGYLAPISLLMVAAVLWLYKGIYSEVVGALPLNGGAYNALLNTTSKFRASVAACLTILSYLATSVISASEAVHYLARLIEHHSHIAVSPQLIFFGTICLMAGFALLTIKGIGESAVVALSIFILHLLSLTLLVFCGTFAFWNNGLETLTMNFQAPAPHPTAYPLFFGFAVAMLGISGFESSANFVEEQQQGVFPKTLRNMWAVVTVFNPIMCVLALALIPLSEIGGNRETLLAELGLISGGGWLKTLISIDATVVLSGAVLTSFVGVTGLVHRMTLDRCLPQLLLSKSRFGTFYRIILVFLFLCILLLCLADDVESLAGVYTISFLSVMALFGVGNILLKIKRSRLPRPTKVSWLTLLIALVAVSAGIAGNIVLNSSYLRIFLLYFAPAILVVTIMLARTVILKAGIMIVQAINRYIGNINDFFTHSMKSSLDKINSQQMVYFTRGDNIADLNSAMLYVRHNEHTNRLKVVTVVNDKNQVPKSLKDDLKFLNRTYPEIEVELIILEGEFGPALLRKLSTQWKVPLNFMFIGSPGSHFPHSLSELGGVRLII